MGGGGGQCLGVVDGLSTRPVGRVPVRRTRPLIHGALWSQGFTRPPRTVSAHIFALLLALNMRAVGA